jgi:hypothetical protein
MPKPSSRRQLAFPGLVCLAFLGWFLALSGGNRSGAQQPKVNFFKEGQYYGVGYCQGCHAKPKAAYEDSLDFVLLTEYSIWASYDKHSLAYVALDCPRGQRIGELLGIEVTKDARCLNCHAIDVPKPRQGPNYDRLDGVSCEGCHGPAQAWSGPHAIKSWREKSAEEKEDLGMRDVRNPIKRAEMCMSCHVGNAEDGKVVTHAMYAAGHPPLPAIDLAFFSKNLPQHWRNPKDVPYITTAEAAVQKRYHYDPETIESAELTLNSSAASLKASMTLLAFRADLKADKGFAERWPELKGADESGPALGNLAGEQWPELAMIHADCYACHHDLLSPSWRQARGFGEGPPGRPTLTAWPFEITSLSIHAKSKYGAETPDQVANQLVAKWKTLRSHWAAQPFGEPGGNHQAAEALEKWSSRLIKDNFEPAVFDRGSALRLLHNLCSLPEKTYPDYYTARLIASAVQGILDELNLKESNDPHVRDILAKLENELNLKPYSGRGKRLNVIKGQVEKLSGKQISQIRDFSAQSVKDIKDKKQLLKALDANEYLRILDADIANAKLRTALFDKQVAKELQEVNDEELQAAMKAVNNYSPFTFKAQLQGLLNALPPE